METIITPARGQYTMDKLDVSTPLCPNMTEASLRVAVSRPWKMGNKRWSCLLELGCSWCWWALRMKESWRKMWASIIDQTGHRSGFSFSRVFVSVTSELIKPSSHFLNSIRAGAISAKVYDGVTCVSTQVITTRCVSGRADVRMITRWSVSCKISSGNSSTSEQDTDSWLWDDAANVRWHFTSSERSKTRRKVTEHSRNQELNQSTGTLFSTGMMPAGE